MTKCLFLTIFTILVSSSAMASPFVCEYIVVRTASNQGSAALEALVNDAIMDGYVPQGGVHKTAVADQPNPENLVPKQWAQAMIRYCDR